jgi:hypothetical protein
MGNNTIRPYLDIVRFILIHVYVLKWVGIKFKSCLDVVGFTSIHMWIEVENLVQIPLQHIWIDANPTTSKQSHSNPPQRMWIDGNPTTSKQDLSSRILLVLY